MRLDVNAHPLEVWAAALHAGVLRTPADFLPLPGKTVKERKEKIEAPTAPKITSLPDVEVRTVLIQHGGTFFSERRACDHAASLTTYLHRLTDPATDKGKPVSFVHGG